MQAVGGLMSITGPEAGTPTRVGVAVVDVLTGLHALAGILAALHHRERTGEGQRVDTNLLSALLSSLVNQGSAYLGAGVVPGILGNRHPSIAPYEVFATKDRPLALAVGNDKQFVRLSETLGVPELATDPRFHSNPQRVAHREELCVEITSVLTTAGADYWYDELSRVGVPAGPINDVAEAFEFARRLGLGAVVAVPGSATPQIANPLSFSRTPVRYRSAPPPLGGVAD